MRYLFIIFTLLIALFLLQNVALSQITPRIQAQNSQANTQPLTLELIKERIRIYVSARNAQNKAAIDKAIATEIGRSGIKGIQPSDSILNDLQKLGAGPKTLQALKDLKTRSENRGTRSGNASNKTIILVADFQGPEIERSSVTNTIIDELSDTTREYPDVEIIPLNEPITAKQGRAWANEKGKEHNASIILWGWYDVQQGQVLANVHFQVLKSSLEFLFSSEKQTLLLPLADFLSFQIRLSKEMAYLTFFTAGFVRFQAGDLAGSIDLFTNAIAESNVPQRMVNPADAYLYRSAAHIVKSWLFGGRVPDQAFEDLQQIINLKSDDTGAYTLRCSAHLLRKEYDLAAADCNKAIELEPNEANGYSGRSNVYLQKGDEKSAIADLETAVKLAPSDSDDLRIFYYRGLLALLKDDFDSVILNFNKVIEQDGSPLFIQPFLLARASAYLGKALNDSAVADLKRVIEITPQHPIAYSLLGDAFYNKKDYTSAISNYRRAIELGLNEAEAYTDLGDAYRDNGDTNQALESYSQAIIIDPGYRETYESRASLYMPKNEFDKAIRDYSKSIELDPKGWYGYFSRGYAYHRKKDFDKALSDYGKAIELMPKNAPTYFFRAITHEAKGEIDEAIDDYGLAAKFNPKDASPYFYRGELYRRKSNYDQAINEYSQAINIDSNYVSAYLSRGLTYVLKSDHKNAIPDLTKVLQLTSDPQIRKQVEQTLDSLGVKQVVPNRD